MPKAAYCSECSRYVWVTGNGGCANGHPRARLRGEYEASVDVATELPLPPMTVHEKGLPRDAQGALGALSHGIWSFVGATGQGLEAQADRIRRSAGTPDPGLVRPSSTMTQGTARPRLSLRWNLDEYVWRESRYLVAGALYVSASVVGCAALGLAGGHTSTLSGWVNLMMLVLVVACMATERNRSSLWQRALFVLAAWILLGLIAEVALYPLSIAFWFLLGGESPMAEAVISTLAGLPIVAYAMRLSSLFVTPIVTSAGA